MIREREREREFGKKHCRSEKGGPGGQKKARVFLFESFSKVLANVAWRIANGRALRFDHRPRIEDSTLGVREWVRLSVRGSSRVLWREWSGGLARRVASTLERIVSYPSRMCLKTYRSSESRFTKRESIPVSCGSRDVASASLSLSRHTHTLTLTLTLAHPRAHARDPRADSRFCRCVQGF